MSITGPLWMPILAKSLLYGREDLIMETRKTFLINNES